MGRHGRSGGWSIVKPEVSSCSRTITSATSLVLLDNGEVIDNQLDLVQIGPDDVDPAVPVDGRSGVDELVARFAPATRRLVDLADFPTHG
jgi:hypothetical protein